uniref:ATP synthase complex subunit 8 n=1 Tax=Haplophryne mollis TaxID=412653 RepID=D3KSA6_HAPMO|nr:ATP synthase F0 subunit 8 [Haplophryne mollis]BAI77343.1 ATPase subunit 8 [Haplophryne mollis]
MPQLNTTPWFITLLTSWTALLFILPSKILSNSFPNNLNLHTTKAYKATAWGWSWY